MISNRRLILPYAAPFLAYVFIASALADVIPVEANYLLRLLVCTALFFWARKWYMELTGPSSVYSSIVYGTLAGLAGLVIWILLLTPFVDPSEAEPWSGAAFLLRLMAAGLLIPLVEEILMRGFFFRLAHQWWVARCAGDDEPLQAALDEQTVNEFVPGDWSWAAVIISTLVFTSGHNVYEWPASIAYGLLMSSLWIFRKDLLSCIVAHGVTNISLALYVLYSGRWYLW